MRNSPPPSDTDSWFLSSVFFEAFSEWDDHRLASSVSTKVINFIRTNPAKALYDFLVATPEDVRLTAVKKFSAGLDQLRAQVECRRARHTGESLSMRRRIYSALLMSDAFELVLQVANGLGLPWKTMQDIGSSNARRIINEVPAFYIEREIVLRLEAQDRPIHENDFRDMQSFCAAIPYVDLVIAERQFINLARQAGLDKKFSTLLATDLSDLAEFLDSEKAGV